MKQVKSAVNILLGNLLIAAGAAFFLIPSGFISGGVTGLSLAINALTGLPLSGIIAVLSFLLLALGTAVLGKNFALASLLSTIFYPIFLQLLQDVNAAIGPLTTSPALNVGCAILIYGYGFSLVMKQGASTGGLDTICLILKSKLGIPLALTMNLFEIASMATQIPFATPEQIICGILISIGFSVLLDFFLAQGMARVQVQIYSPRHEEINRMILSQFQRGSTLFLIEGGFSRERSYAIQTVVSSRELFRLKEAVLKVDPTAFLTVSRISEVSGRGFTLDKIIRSSADNHIAGDPGTT